MLRISPIGYAIGKYRDCGGQMGRAGVSYLKLCLGGRWGQEVLLLVSCVTDKVTES